MKGITHFTVGLSVASCFPEAVGAAVAGHSLYFVLGGIFGLLPDTIDFKFYRFFCRHDIEVIPVPNRPDPQMIADAVAMAVNRAHDTNRLVKLRLDTIRLGADLWQRYEVTLDVPNRQVIVNYGPTVDTGRNPVPGTEPATPLTGHARLACPVKLDYMATTTIDIFEGPLFHIEPTTDGKVIPRFIPWHRHWTHSFVTGLLFALVGAVIWDPLAGLVIFGAHAAHIIFDQAGFMGSNLFYPFTSRRSEGLKWMHAVDAVPNFTTVWLSCLIIFWNLYSAMPWTLHFFNPVKLIFYGALIPAAVYAMLRRVWRRSRP